MSAIGIKFGTHERPLLLSGVVLVELQNGCGQVGVRKTGANAPGNRSGPWRQPPPRGYPSCSELGIVESISSLLQQKPCDGFWSMHITASVRKSMVEGIIRSSRLMPILLPAMLVSRFSLKATQLIGSPIWTGM